MIRLEIIANNTVESDIYKALNDVEEGFNYTRLNNVHGRGNSDPRMGDNVWPEENFVYIIYTDDSTGEKMITSIKEIKKKFKIEGIKVFYIAFNEI
ncbi:MAG: PG0541 family transporter-associated protein [Pleomorphochaeta sp.]